MRRSWKTSLLLALGAGTAITAAPAQALTFNLIDTGGTAQGTIARHGFEAAAFYWSSVLTNNVTVNLNIGFSALAPNVLGSTGSATTLQFNSAYYMSLFNNMTSSADLTAVTNLRPLSVSAQFGLNAVTAQANALNDAGTGYVDTALRTDNDGSQNNSVVSINKSTSKALGMVTDANGAVINGSTPDGTVLFSSSFGFDFEPRNGITSTDFDFIGVAIHEIGHALGFRSGVDTYDAFTAPGNGTPTNSRAGALENVTVATGLDMFRYSAPGVLDWSTQGTPYFSIDGGQTQVFGSSLVSTGVRNGDGRQASHFKDSPAGAPQLGILDPTSGRGQMQEITALDLTAFDVIGWRTAFDPLRNASYRIDTATVYQQYLNALPEPGTWMTMILGFGFAGAAVRRKWTVRVAFAA
ncbi:NF038122 family metalloprotease [uncultured Sphingomonas sp.]|uniref:NF038122 family metalloprotease n=1 Tax=uncultured Sphingomonas sp. TaxID=158754 RepID=UPI0035CC3E84